MVPFLGRSFLRQYLPYKPHKWGFKIWGRSGVSGFLYDFDVNQGRSNKNNSIFGVIGHVMANLCSTLPIYKKLQSVCWQLFYQSTTVWALQIRWYLVYWNYSCTTFKKGLLLVEKDRKKKGMGNFLLDMLWGKTNLLLGQFEVLAEARISISEKKRPLADSTWSGHNKQ